MHWYPLTTPGVVNEMVAPAVGFAPPLTPFFPCLTFARVIRVPFGGPKVAVTVRSPSILTWQGPVPAQGPVNPAKPLPGTASARRISTWLSGKSPAQPTAGQTIPFGPPT